MNSDLVHLDGVRYANCWEDPDILIRALQPHPGKHILSVASAGDNSLALLAEGARVVAVDLNAAQLACLELRCAAIRRLGYRELLGFLGLRPQDHRLRTFDRIQGDLSPRARGFWRKRPDDLSRGVIHGGELERYFQRFRRWLLPRIHRKRTVAEFLALDSRKARERFYETRWNTWRWRLLFRLFFSRFIMSRLGRDPQLFRFVEGRVSDRVLARIRRSLTVLPADGNPFLEYILRGNFRHSLPRYLLPEKVAAIRRNLHRLAIFHGTVEEAAAAHGGRGFDGFNLSDIFEYLGPDACRQVYLSLLERAKPGARFAYWNLLVPRRCPEELSGRVRHLEDLSRVCHEHDRAFFYSAFVVEERGRALRVPAESSRILDEAR